MVILALFYLTVTIAFSVLVVGRGDIAPSTAFVAITTTHDKRSTATSVARGSHRMHRLLLRPLKANFESLEELDDARRRFEAMFASNNNSNDSSSAKSSNKKKDKRSKTKPRGRPMTTLSRRRRQIEIDLLQSLQDSDDAVEELVMLWLTERGPEKAQLLQDMQEECSVGLVREEQLLRQLLAEDDDENGSGRYYWSEAMFRLATLLYYKGDSTESKQLCAKVLIDKPWHFEAAHLALLHAFRDEALPDELWKCARRRLPPLNHNNDHARRKQWVAMAVAQAQSMLEHDELEWIILQQQQQEEEGNDDESSLPSLPSEENSFC